MTTALITGANKGVGFATARAMASRGIHVWLGARSVERGERAERLLRGEGFSVEFVQLDVTDAASIAAAAARIGQNAPSLDILVNNAGIMNELTGPGLNAIPPSQTPLHLLRAVYETNLFGMIATTQAMLPMLRRSPAGRIVNVASRLASFGCMSDKEWVSRAINLLGYGSSKAALNFATLSFAIELQDTPIKINAVSPGTIATDLSGTPAAELARQPGYGRPEDGAALIVQYATLAEDGPTGGFFGPGGKLPW